jgi:hypothetical protein
VPGPIILSIALLLGMVFSSLAQTNFSQVKLFGFDNQIQPVSGLIEGSDGVLYGLTASDGKNGGSCLFKLQKNGNGFQILGSLPKQAYFDLSGTKSKLIEGKDGFIYGGSIDNGLFKASKNGGGLQVLLNRPVNPYFVHSPDGFIYGFSTNGLFRIRGDGSGFMEITNIPDFQQIRCGIIEGTNETFYGLASGFMASPQGAFQELSTRLVKTGRVFKFCDGLMIPPMLPTLLE